MGGFRRMELIKKMDETPAGPSWRYMHQMGEREGGAGREAARQRGRKGGREAGRDGGREGVKRGEKEGKCTHTRLN